MGKGILDRTLNDNSTMWGGVSGMFGALTVSEWCLLITALVTVFNFLKNWYIDMRKLNMLEREHLARLEGKIQNEDD